MSHWKISIDEIWDLALLEVKLVYQVKMRETPSSLCQRPGTPKLWKKDMEVMGVWSSKKF